jgi:hypothetical protein
MAAINMTLVRKTALTINQTVESIKNDINRFTGMDALHGTALRRAQRDWMPLLRTIKQTMAAYRDLARSDITGHTYGGYNAWITALRSTLLIHALNYNPDAWFDDLIAQVERAYKKSHAICYKLEQNDVRKFFEACTGQSGQSAFGRSAF